VRVVVVHPDNCGPTTSAKCSNGSVERAVALYSEVNDDNDVEWVWEDARDGDEDPFPILELDDDDLLLFPVPHNEQLWQLPELTGTTTTTAGLIANRTQDAAQPLTLDQLSETFATNVSYFYLKNELKLSDTAMWRITYEASSALGISTAVIRHKIDVLRDTMGLSDDDVRTILERQPTMLHLSASKNTAPTMLFLLRALDLGKEELKRLVVSCPAVLCYSLHNLQSKILFFTNTMEYTKQECRELLLKEPKLLRSSVETGLVPHWKFLSGDLELAQDEMKRIVLKNPSILLYSLDRNLVPKLVFYLIMKLSMTTRQVAKILLAYPQILDYNLDRTILPITMYYVKELDFSLTEFRSMLLKFPRLLTQSLRKNKYTVGYFRFALSLPAINVKKILYRAPAILGLNVDQNIKPKVEYLRSRLDLTDAELAIVLTAMPSLLLLSVDDNLGPKVDYLLAALVPRKNLATPFATNMTSLVRETVLRLPTLLGYSLSLRIRPRVEAIVQAGLDPASCITIGIPMKQEAFDVWLQRRAEKRSRSSRSDDQDSVDGSSLVRSQSSIPPTSLLLNEGTAAPPPPPPPQRIMHWSRERQPPPDAAE
jgi:mTERF domain-containing protein, mitochondrial